MARPIKMQNKMRLKVEGVDNVVQELKRANDLIKKELHDLISEAAEIVFREADAKVPIGQTKKTRYSLRIEIGENKKGFFANVVVGSKKGDTTANSAFYVTFYELGTSRQPPRPFMRPAYDKSKSKIRAHITEGLRKIIAGLGE